MISWKSVAKSNSELVEHLFVSEKAFLDGSKAVRGGIPVVFPCFGLPVHPQHSKLSQHGFARSELWKWDKVLAETETEVSVQLSMSIQCCLKNIKNKAGPYLDSTGSNSEHHSQI